MQITQDAETKDHLPQKTSRPNCQKDLIPRNNPLLFESHVTCLEGDRPNEERIQATGKHVA